MCPPLDLFSRITRLITLSAVVTMIKLLLLQLISPGPIVSGSDCVYLPSKAQEGSADSRALLDNVMDVYGQDQ